MFELFKSTVDKIKNNEENIQNDEVKALNSIVALLVEAASIDGEIGNDEKNQIENILIERLNLDKIKAEKILEQTIISPSWTIRAISRKKIRISI